MQRPTLRAADDAEHSAGWKLGHLAYRLRTKALNSTDRRDVGTRHGVKFGGEIGVRS
jgi:hypothetical protein